MDSNIPPRIKNPIPPREVPPVGQPKNPVPPTKDLRAKKLRILIICALFFLVVNTIIFIVLICWIISGNKSSSTDTLPEEPVAEAPATPPETPSDSTDTPPKDTQEAAPKKPNDNNDPKKVQGKTESDLGSLPKLKTDSLADFEDSFFELFDACPEIALKERLLFAFMILHVYWEDISEDLEMDEEYGPTEFLKKFATVISSPEFAMFSPEDKISETEKQEKEEDLLRIADSIREKIKQNRQSNTDDFGPIPHTLHFEIFTLVKKNPQLKIFLHKALDNFEINNTN